MQGVYSIPYSCGKTYIRKTKRSIKVILKEHNTGIIHNIYLKSTLVEHSYDNNHHNSLEKEKVIAKISNYTKRKVKSEEHNINLAGPENLNKDEIKTLN
jgi:hypothetical protein